MIIIFTITGLGWFLVITYQHNFTFKARTKTELVKMTEWSDEWREKYGDYPSDLDELIGKSPMRQQWREDGWGNPYVYKETESGFFIVSAGSDEKFWD